MIYSSYAVNFNMYMNFLFFITIPLGHCGCKYTTLFVSHKTFLKIFRKFFLTLFLTQINLSLLRTYPPKTLAFLAAANIQPFLPLATFKLPILNHYKLTPF